jgi:hypothetical protein
MRSVMVMVVLALGCGGASANRASTIPAEAQPRWNACRAAMTEHCHHLGHGDPSIENQCERDTQAEFAALTTDEARTQYLTSHGCRATP